MEFFEQAGEPMVKGRVYCHAEITDALMASLLGSEGVEDRIGGVAIKVCKQSETTNLQRDRENSRGTRM
jgi:hypothetical protein